MKRITNQTGLSRRGVLRGAAAAGAAGLVLPGMAGAARAQTRGGTFRIGIGHGSTTDGLDPGLWDNLYPQTFAAARHNYLIEVAADGQLVPELAESWESDDGITWVFRIRPGVTFHSGKTMTVEDVIASINHHRGEASTSAVKTLLDPVTDLRADGANLIVTLEAPNADLPYLMSDYHIPIMPAVDGGIDVNSTDGCGGYVVESYEPGVQATRHPQPGLLEIGPRLVRPDRDAVDPRPGGAAQRADHRSGASDRPGRSGHHRHARRPRRRAHPVGARQRPLRLSDGLPGRAVFGQQCPPGAEIRHRPAGDGRCDPGRPRCGCQRQPDRPGKPLFLRRHGSEGV
jgi:hypothetical protein